MFPLFHAPFEFLCMLLSDWIDVGALTRLDSALCAIAQRREFLTLTSSEIFVYDTMLIDNLNELVYNEQIKWLVLRKIKVRHLKIGFDLSPSSVANLVKTIGGPHVRTLYVDDLSKESSMALFPVLSMGCPNIEIVVMENAEHWTAISALTGQAAVSLRVLSITDCTDDSGNEFFRSYFPNLLKITVRDLAAGDSELQSVAGLLRTAPNLTYLQLAYIDADDEVIDAIRDNAEKLQSLWLVGNAVSATAMKALAPRCVNLRCLVIGECEEIDSDAPIVAFANSCKHLEGVKLQGAFTQAAVSAFVRNCSATLRNLSLEDFTFTDDAGVLNIATHCPLLEALELRSCTGITTAALCQLVRALPQLRELVLADLSNAVNDSVVAAIAKHLPMLTLVNQDGSADCADIATLPVLHYVKSAHFQH